MIALPTEKRDPFAALMSVDEAAAALGKDRRQIINYLNSGKLHGKKIGRGIRGSAWMVSRASVEEFKRNPPPGTR